MANERRNTRRRRPAPRSSSLSQMLKLGRASRLQEFKPDAREATWLKTVHMTETQKLRYAKWGLYILTVVMSLVIQDVLMSQIRIFGATTDLPVCAILLITVIEGTEVGSLFVLVASTLYYFSGTAPGAYCIGLLTLLGVGATLFRQMYWHRSRGSVVLCAAIALTLYEIGLFAVGVFNGLTIVSRANLFLLTAAYSCAVLLPMYSLITKIGLIGGNTWKE